MRAVWAVFCLCWLAIGAAASSSAALPSMSAEEAVSIAQWFAQKQNLPLKGSPKPEFLGSDRSFLTPPSWNVRFDPSGTIQIDAETGRVLAFQVFPAAIRKTRPRDRAISQDRAVETATKVAEGMGLLADAVRRSATLMSVAGPGDVWSIAWERRTPDGIRFNDDELTVYLRAASGQPTGGHLCWSSRMPESMEVKVSKEQAAAIALRLASKRGPLLKEPTFRGELKIVHPNGHWTKKPLRTSYDGPTRLAWVVELVREPAQLSRTFFWIDAADGSLLGGEEPVLGTVRRLVGE